MAIGMVIWKDLMSTKAKMKVYLVEVGDSNATGLAKGHVVDITNLGTSKEGDFVTATVSDKVGYPGLYETPAVTPTAPDPPPQGTVKGQIITKEPSKKILKNAYPKVYHTYNSNPNFTEGDCVYYTLNGGMATIGGFLIFSNAMLSYMVIGEQVEEHQ